MKLTITIDQPDALLEGVADYAEEATMSLLADARDAPLGDGPTDDELDREDWRARTHAEKVLAIWWGEDGVCTLEFDLDAQPPTARVLRRDEQSGERS